VKYLATLCDETDGQWGLAVAETDSGRGVFGDAITARPDEHLRAADVRLARAGLIRCTGWTPARPGEWTAAVRVRGGAGKQR